MEQAREWSKAPWDVTGEHLTQWRRLVWRERYKLYNGEIAAKRRREYEDYQLRQLQNGR